MFTDLINNDMQDNQDNYNDELGCDGCGELCFIVASGRSNTCVSCDERENELEEQNGGIDKCMNCGRYKWGNQLNKYQVCRIGCVNPNEY